MKLFPDDSSFSGGRKVIASGPARSAGFIAVVDQSCLERLEQRVAVSKIVDVDLIEIIKSSLAGHVLSPIFGIAPQDEARASLRLLDNVGTGADRFGESRVLEMFDVGRMFGKHRHQREN